MPREALPEPWLSFLRDLDQALTRDDGERPTELHCVGGFAVVQAYGIQRATADIDVVGVAPYGSGRRLIELAGKGRSCNASTRSTWM